MKKLLTLLSGILCATTTQAQTGNPAPYCVSLFDNNYNMIQSVGVNGTNFNTGPVGSWSSQNSYTYFTNASFPSVLAGNTVTLGVSFFSVTDWEPRYFGVWIDFNANNTFDNSELVMNNAMTTNTDLPTGGGAAQLITLPITIPMSAMSGTTRLRVVRSQAPTGSPYIAYSSTMQALACNPVASNQAYGCTYDFNLNITSANAPQANFSVSPATPCSGKPVVVTDQSSNAPTSWTWTAIGATATISAVQNPTFTFASAGTYTLAMMSANASGMSSPVIKTLTITATPQLTLTPANTTVCAKKSVTLSVTGAETYSWNTGASTSILLVSPSVTTVYTVTGTNANVCSTTISRTVTVNACTDISETKNNLNSFQLVPNPGTGLVQVNFIAPLSEKYSIRVTNSIGQIILEQNSEQNLDLNLEGNAPGIYFISLANEAGIVATKKYLLQ